MAIVGADIDNGGVATGGGGLTLADVPSVTEASVMPTVGKNGDMWIDNTPDVNIMYQFFENVGPNGSWLSPMMTMQMGEDRVTATSNLAYAGVNAASNGTIIQKPYPWIMTDIIINARTGDVDKPFNFIVNGQVQGPSISLVNRFHSSKPWRKFQETDTFWLKSAGGTNIFDITVIYFYRWYKEL